ncbi:hypothetical protein Pcinc_019817 [Petrolisthes cinctipes]|uniref:Protein sleepless n=1 Tax=Petrolisthes cinctipes TaxID=88211 RepID=A0AAE1FK94_PETCI|nr:hypothetical protein Pcinc_019817 [Petrolisthes cinctipes]
MGCSKGTTVVCVLYTQTLSQHYNYLVPYEDRSMTNMKVAVVIMVLMAYLHVGYGLKCYQCSDCLKFKCSTFYDADECPTTSKSCSKTFKDGVDDGDKEMVRGCSDLVAPTTACDATTELCLCDGEECNSGRTITPTSTLALALVLAAAGRCLFM